MTVSLRGNEKQATHYFGKLPRYPCRMIALNSSNGLTVWPQNRIALHDFLPNWRNSSIQLAEYPLEKWHGSERSWVHGKSEGPKGQVWPGNKPSKDQTMVAFRLFSQEFSNLFSAEVYWPPSLKRGSYMLLWIAWMTSPSARSATKSQEARCDCLR
jgi:hypothetical protein